MRGGNSWSPETPLNLGLKYKPEWDVIRLMLDYGADVNIKQSNGDTALYTAVGERVPHDVLLRLITSENINVQCGSNGWTALQHAAYICHSDKDDYCRDQTGLNTAHTLLEHGADCNIVNKMGKTPLQLYLRMADLDNLCLFVGE